METDTISGLLVQCWKTFEKDYRKAGPLLQDIGHGMPSKVHWSEADIQYKLASSLEKLLGETFGDGRFAVHLEVFMRKGGRPRIDLAVVETERCHEALLKHGFTYCYEVAREVPFNLVVEIAVVLHNRQCPTYGRKKVESNLANLREILEERLSDRAVLCLLDKTNDKPNRADKRKFSEWLEAQRKDPANSCIEILDISDRNLVTGAP